MKLLKDLNLRKKLVVIKFTLNRGYAWCQLPTLAMIGAGIVKPYFPSLHYWQLCVIAMSIFIIVGIIDRQFKFLHEEQDYMTNNTPLLMKGLRGQLK